MTRSIARLSTQNGRRYIKRLCKHFSHKIQASFHQNEGSAVFPFGFCLMKNETEQLVFTVEADNEENRKRVEAVVTKHLHQFSHHEELAVTWHVQDEP